MPTYLYRNTVSGDQIEVVQKITAKAFQKWGEIFESTQETSYIGCDKNDPVIRVPNWDGAGFISGEGVYKQGLISSSANEQKEKPPKSNVTRYTIADIMKEEDEDE